MIEQRDLKIQYDDTFQAMRIDPAGSKPSLKDSVLAFEKWASADLYDRAQELQIEGHDFMTKTELITALRQF